MVAPAVVLLTILASYLAGSIPFGYLVAKWRGVDIFRQGSGNIGATNVGRVLGRPFGVLVFVLDFAKGAIPVTMAGWIDRRLDLQLLPSSLEAGAGLAAFLGHLFPVFLRFHGGKGVATGAGVVAVLLPGPTAGALAAWLLVVCLTRYVSLASLAAVATLCALRIATVPEPFSEQSITLTVFCLVAALLVVWRHRANIHRLLKGNENRIKDSMAMLQLTKVVHVLMLGLWFGSVVFFSLVVAPSVFAVFQSLAEAPPNQRPAWLPSEMHVEQGTQLAGIAVGPVFPWYFLIQGICGLFVVATALNWTRSRPDARVHRLRFYISALALATVIAAWPLGQRVEVLRMARYAADSSVAQAAKESFATWHLASLLLNFVTMILVTAVMALAAWLPGFQGSDDAVNAAAALPRRQSSGV
jgi:acyl-phosphate glycerol 3-phosphate acyltransferase